MSKAKITLSNGTEVLIEGTPSDVAAILAQISPIAPQHNLSNEPVGNRSKKSKKITSSPTDLVLSLADGGFFKTPKDLAAIKAGLAEIGHIYPVQTLSSILFKMVRRRYLRRVKQEGRWVYVR